MTESTYNKITKHIKAIEMCVVHTNDTGFGRTIVGELIQIQKEYNPDARPVDTSCGSCILSLFKDVYRNYMNYK